MRSVTSCFNSTLYKKDLARFWPLWTLYTVLLTFLLPINLLAQYADSQSWNSHFNPLNWAKEFPVELIGSPFGSIVALIYGAAIAMFLWSYLYNNRSANMMHTLPIRREGHFLTHFASGVTFFLLPHGIVFLLTLGAEAFCGGVYLPALAGALGSMTLLCLFFFSFATLCAMLTGHILFLPLFYGIFNGVVFGVTALVDWISTFFLYGYNGGLLELPAVRWLTPMYAIVSDFRCQYPREQVIGVDGVIYSKLSGEPPVLVGWSTLWIYAAVGVVMAAIALLLYRKRHMETAGDVVAVLPLRPVFLYCMAFCSALAGGCLMYEMLSMNGLPFLLGSLVVWCFIGYFAGLMLLHKSFRVFRKGWKGCAAAVCVLLALCGVLHFDLLGIERSLPDAEDVVSVTVRGVDTVPYDSASYIRSVDNNDPLFIRKVLDVHQAIINEKEEQQNRTRSADYDPDAVDLLYQQGLASTQYFRVEYQLSNGRTFARQYHGLYIAAEDLEDPNSLEYALDVLINDRNMLFDLYDFDLFEQGKLVGAAIEDPASKQVVLLRGEGEEFSYDIPYYEKYNKYSDPDLPKIVYEVAYETSYSVPAETKDYVSEAVPAQLTELTVTAEQLAELKDGVLTDFSANRLGIHYLFDGTQERKTNTTVANLLLIYEYTAPRSDGSTRIDVNRITVTFTPQGTDTLLELRDMGAFEYGLALTDHNGDVIYKR